MSLMNENSDTKIKQRHKAQSKAINEHYAIVSFDLNGNIVDLNKNFSKLFGYKKKKLMGKHHKTLCPTEFIQSDEYKQFWEDLINGKIQSKVFRRIKKNGETVFIRASYKPLLDENGEVFEILKFAQDVTSKKLENLNYENTISAINKSTSIIEFDTDGFILNANQNFLNLTGYRLDEIKDKHHRLFCEDFFSNSREYLNFWEKLKSGKFDSAEYLRLGKNGKKIWIRATYNPIYDLDGNVIKIMKFAQDITEEKVNSILHAHSLSSKNDELQKIIDAEVKNKIELETQLLQQSKMAEMGNMLDNILHQWKQPLTVLSLKSSEILTDIYTDNFDKDYTIKSINTTLDLIRFMNETSNEFRNFFSSNKTSEDFNLVNIVNSIEKILAHRITESNCIINKVVDESLFTHGYKNELAQVLLSILNNAFDKFDEAKTENNALDIIIQLKDNKNSIKICDNGSLIPDELLPDKLFKREVTTKEKGTGVGLSIAKDIIEKHFKGSLLAYNEDNKVVFEIII